MACCGDKACCKKTSDNAMPFSVPVPAALIEFIAKMMEIAGAGLDAGKIFRSLSLNSPTLERLAKQIADLAIENAYLKSVVNLFAPMDVGVGESDFTVNFGPDHKYSLKIPLKDGNSRKEIVKQLRAAATRLENDIKAVPENTFYPAQQMLPFSG